MPSAIEIAKRVLVKVLKALAVKHKLCMDLNRDSTERQVHQAFKRVALKTHPDKGGDQTYFQRLSVAHGAWQDLLKNRSSAGRPRKAEHERARTKHNRHCAGNPFTVVVPSERKVYRLQSAAVLFTYQSFPAELLPALAAWGGFVAFVRRSVRRWGVKHWTATAETNENGRHHFHLMVQYSNSQPERHSAAYAFQGVLPNAAANDILGGSFGGKRYQASWDRGQFYVWANKRGTLVDNAGVLCRAGNCGEIVISASKKHGLKIGTKNGIIAVATASIIIGIIIVMGIIIIIVAALLGGKRLIRL